MDFFCLGIDHPLALPVGDDPDLRPRGGFSMRGHSVGGFGSVTTNKVIATIAGNVFGKDVQAYPKYGSEKKGLPTTYYLTVAESQHQPPPGTGNRRAFVHQRPDRHPQSLDAQRAWFPAARSSCSPPTPNRWKFGSGYRRKTRSSSATRRSVFTFAIWSASRARLASEAETCAHACREHRPSVARFLRFPDSLRQGSANDRRSGLRGRRKSPA